MTLLTKPSSCQPEKKKSKKKEKYLSSVTPWRRQLDTVVMRIRLKNEDKLLGLAEVGRRYFEAAFQLSGLTQLNWRGKKKQTNKTNNFF